METNLQPLPDTQIIGLLEQKNKQAIEAILDKYGDILYGLFYQKYPSEIIAKQKMQQAFIQMWQSEWKSPLNEDKLLHWLLKMVVHNS